MPTSAEAAPVLDALYVELTSRCNLRCPYCFNRSNERPVREWSPTDLRAVFGRVLTTFEVGEIYLSGGEVFRHPQWLEIVEFVAEAALPTTILTNGLQVPPRLALGRLSELGFGVSVSIGGVTAEQDEPLRGAGAWSRTVAGIDEYMRSGLIRSLVYIVHQQNLGSIGDAINFAAERRIPGLKFGLIRPLGRAAEHWATLGLSAADRLRFASSYGRTIVPKGLNVQVLSDPLLYELGSVLHSTLTTPSAGYKELCLRYDGRIEYPQGDERYEQRMMAL